MEKKPHWLSLKAWAYDRKVLLECKDRILNTKECILNDNNEWQKIIQRLTPQEKS